MKNIIFILAVTFSITLFADMPGNRRRPDQELIIYNTSQFPEYSFYIRNGYDDTAELVKDSSVYILPGGGGSPIRLFLYAVRNTDSFQTKSVAFDGYSSSHYIIIHGVNMQDSTLVFHEAENVKAKKKGETEFLLPEDNSGNMTPLLITLAVVGLISIIVAYYLKRKKNSRETT
ncbi:MAG: hypothetical protein Fur0041_18430 [Bacteroidia bacterium]